MTSGELSPAQEKKSAAILDAARTHFAQHGFEATKLSDIARDAGVAVGTIYLRYASKAELLGGVLDSVEGAFCAAIDTPKIWKTPFPDRFEKIVAAIFETARSQTHLAELMALSAFAVQSEHLAKRPMLSQIEAHISDGAARRELRVDMDVPLAAAMAHGIVEAAMREMMSNANRKPADAMAHIVDVYKRWLIAP